MILPFDRKVALVLCRLGGLYLRQHFFSTYYIFHRRGFGWIYKIMLRRQTRDGLHHAPACPGNEWSGATLVFMRCNCGAARIARGGAGQETSNITMKEVVNGRA